jgi:hypothetical protein
LFGREGPPREFWYGTANGLQLCGRSNKSALASQQGTRVFCHSMLCGRTRWECVSQCDGRSASQRSWRCLQSTNLIVARRPGQARRDPGRGTIQPGRPVPPFSKHAT